jgi:hypothetical protein
VKNKIKLKQFECFDTWNRRSMFGTYFSRAYFYTKPTALR